MVVVSMNGASGVGGRQLNNSHGDVISYDKSFFKNSDPVIIHSGVGVGVASKSH
jgi:hypothetical protein